MKTSVAMSEEKMFTILMVETATRFRLACKPADLNRMFSRFYITQSSEFYHHVDIFFFFD